MDETRELAKFVCNLRYEDLPQEVIETAKDLTLDSLGVQLAASTKPWSQIVYRYVKQRAGPLAESTIVNYGDKTSATDAAFANASFAHGFEYDDTHRESNNHLSCIIVPSALAVGEGHSIDGRQYLLAMVLGCDVMARVGEAITPSRYACGYRAQPTPVTGPLGAAAAASKILRLDEDTTLNALSIAASHSGGLEEFTKTGGSMKRMHAGIAAEGGIRATLLAEDGLTGPPTALEGEWGLCRIFTDGIHYDLKALVSDIGNPFKITQVAYKRYCQSYCQHTKTEAMINMRTKHHIDPAEVDKITVYTDKFCCMLEDPQEITAAQFSPYFSLALALVKGACGFNEYTDENLWDPAVRAVFDKITFIEDDAMDVGHGQRPAKLIVTLKDETTYQDRVDFAKGTPEYPMTRQELEEKFMSLATVIVPESKARRIIAAIDELEDLEDVSTLAGLLKQ